MYLWIYWCSLLRFPLDRNYYTTCRSFYQCPATTQNFQSNSSLSHKCTTMRTQCVLLCERLMYACHMNAFTQKVCALSSAMWPLQMPSNTRSKTNSRREAATSLRVMRSRFGGRAFNRPAYQTPSSSGCRHAIVAARSWKWAVCVWESLAKPLSK